MNHQKSQRIPEYSSPFASLMNAKPLLCGSRQTGPPDLPPV